LALLARANAGEFAGIVAGIPCSTFSVARFKPGGAPVVRRKPGEERGLHRPPPGHDSEAANANLLLQRTVEIIRAIHSCGGFFVVENPIDRSDADLSARLRLGHWPKHASLWAMEEIEELRKDTKAKTLHFPQCSLGQVAQKFTTLMFSSELDLSALEGLTCSHSRREHRWSNKRNADGSWATAALAAYPPELNRILAEALAAAILQQRVTTSHFQPGQQAWWASSDGATVRECSVVDIHWDDGDPYYTVEFEDGQTRGTDRQHLRNVAPPVVGSRRPHAGASAAAASAPDPEHMASTASLRRNEPELEQVLEVEALPAVNVPPSTDWYDPPEDEAPVPGPLTTDELIPRHVQEKVLRHGARVREVFRRAHATGGWRVARDLRPDPLVFTEKEAMLPAGWGWAWHRHDDGKWYPLTRSRWPQDPPESDLDVPSVLGAIQPDPARFGEGDKGFSDKYVAAAMAHGFDAPELELATVLGYPHVGALKSAEAVDKMVAKDRRQDSVEGKQAWTEHGGDLPQVWPVRADPINIVWRAGKPRMTIDKSMRLCDAILSYNESVDLGDYDPVTMVRVGQLCRAASVQLTAGVGVRIWKFDLDSYFRRTGKQRRTWWQSGYILPDGYGFDKRIQFGQKEAPVLTSRESNLIVWAIRREIKFFDSVFRPTDARLRAWVLLRSMLATGQLQDQELHVALCFCMLYVDDAGGASMDDELSYPGGGRMYGAWHSGFECYVPCDAGSAGATPMRRPDAHYAIALAVVVAFGHGAALGKGQAPSLRMDLLGVDIDVGRYRRQVPAEKCKSYGSAAREALRSPSTGQDALRAPRGDFNSLVHKLLHASETVVLGRQHVHYCMQALRTENRMREPVVLLFEPQIRELRWWVEQFDHPERHCLPLASRLSFPFSDSVTTLAAYSDAARELQSPSTSGFGAWTVYDGVMYWLAGLWTVAELQSLSINVLELAAANMSTFTFLEHSRLSRRHVTHVVDFIDNTAAEYSADRGKPHQGQMRELVASRFDALDRLRVYPAAERITSTDNEWADGLSRGEERVADVLRFAHAAGLRTHRLQPHPVWRDTSRLMHLAP